MFKRYMLRIEPYGSYANLLILHTNQMFSQLSVWPRNNKIHHIAIYWSSKARDFAAKTPINVARPPGLYNRNGKYNNTYKILHLKIDI